MDSKIVYLKDGITLLLKQDLIDKMLSGLILYGTNEYGKHIQIKDWTMAKNQ